MNRPFDGSITQRHSLCDIREPANIALAKFSGDTLSSQFRQECPCWVACFVGAREVHEISCPSRHHPFADMTAKTAQTANENVAGFRVQPSIVLGFAKLYKRLASITVSFQLNRVPRLLLPHC